MSELLKQVSVHQLVLFTVVWQSMFFKADQFSNWQKAVEVFQFYEAQFLQRVIILFPLSYSVCNTKPNIDKL